MCKRDKIVEVLNRSVWITWPSKKIKLKKDDFTVASAVYLMEMMFSRKYGNSQILSIHHSVDNSDNES